MVSVTGYETPDHWLYIMWGSIIPFTHSVFTNHTLITNYTVQQLRMFYGNVHEVLNLINRVHI